MAFTPQKTLLDMYIIQNVILSNSITVNIGDALIINTGSPQFATVNGSGTGIILGTVRAISNGPAGGNVYLQETSVTTASNNTTVAQVSVDILASNAPQTYVADLDNPTGTTPNSQYFGYFNILSGTAGKLQEASYSASAEKQFLSYGVNPGNSSQVVGIFTKIAQA